MLKKMQKKYIFQRKILDKDQESKLKNIFKEDLIELGYE